MDLSDSDGNFSSHEEDMDLLNIKESSPSNAEDMDLSEASGSSLSGDLDSSDAQDIGSSGDEESSASSKASSVIRFSGPARRQNWSLPNSIIFYLAKNPSTPKLYQKLIRTCKYFFLINPITICSDLTFKPSEEKDVSSADEVAQKGGAENADVWEIKQYLNIKNIFDGKVNKDIDLMNYSAKIWIFDSCVYYNYSSLIVNGDGSNKNLVSSIIPKIYRCNAENLRIFDQNLSYNEFSFLATSTSKIEFEKVTVKFDDDIVVPVEKIVECAKKATHFDIKLDDNDASISSETVNNLLEIPHFSNIVTFYLKNIPDSFDIETLFAYLKKHKRTSFCLSFSDSISAAYKKRLEKMIDEIIEAGGRGGYESPIIVFPGLDVEKLVRLSSCFLVFVRRIP